MNLRGIDKTIWGSDKDNLYIGRKNKFFNHSIWANPFKLICDSHPMRIEVVSQYTSFLLDDDALLNQIPSLLGKSLGCWCSPSLCHGSILIELLNEIIIYIN